MRKFTGSFTQQEPLPEDAIEAAVEVMRSGRLHRYNIVEGEVAPAARLEEAFAEYMGARYCLACASGGYALHVALRAAGLRAGEVVLTNAFSLAPVPGAIDNAGGVAVLVETNAELVIDLDDLEEKLEQHRPGFLLLSHMRGHIVDMDALCALLQRYGTKLIEDCAHTMGASWDGRKSGSFGLAGCFSTQTYKHLNSGEGGLLVSDDPDFMARAIFYSGSYMLYERHGLPPAPEAFAQAAALTPNYSGRMDNLRAALLLPQLRRLEDNCERWNQRYRLIANCLGDVAGIRLPQRDPKERYVGSSIQFFLDNRSGEEIQAFLAACLDRGIEVKWFGASEPSGYTSRYDHWGYLQSRQLPRTDRILHGLCDIRIPLTFSPEDCEQVGKGIAEAFAQTCIETREAV
ncbi:MAG: DegT/DnrJ/EryC1/StrS family aminotransferase [Hyphomicrobiales bacterium]|nr:DegT/DnrJ/EryC1/StrS family aminotransferase [Hyphomicrobiales bacterium]MCY4033378.1 DegT/DnrJ/EryC1/StrS family aminotransferase [Hyphomicrobiales bacterium]